MRLVKPSSEERPTPRGMVGGSEISQATTGATNIFMGRFQVPAGAQSRPHYHANCESALYMLSGLEIRWGDHLEERARRRAGRHALRPAARDAHRRNRSATEPAEYVVARDSPTEDSVEVPWASEG